MEFITHELILRTVTECDIEEIARMWKYPEETTIEDAHNALKYMEQTHSKNRPKAICHLCLGVFRKEEPNKLIGWCGLDGEISPDETVLFYIIAEEFRCRGYATQCAVELLRYAFEEMKYDVVYSACAKENKASFRVMEKAGMNHNVVYEDGGLGFYMDKEMFAQTQCKMNITRNNVVDSRCGLHCSECEYKESCGCGGCIETNGHPFHGECPIAVCCQIKGFIHCGECPDIPCEQLYAYSYLDKEHGDNPPGARVEQCKRWAKKDT